MSEDDIGILCFILHFYAVRFQPYLHRHRYPRASVLLDRFPRSFSEAIGILFPSDFQILPKPPKMSLGPQLRLCDHIKQ